MLVFSGYLFGRAIRHVFSRSLLYTLSVFFLESCEVAATGNIIVVVVGIHDIHGGLRFQRYTATLATNIQHFR